MMMMITYEKNYNFDIFSPHRFTELPEDFLTNHVNLTMIDIRDNWIERIHPKAFSGAPNVVSIYMPNNRLEEIEIGAFDGLTKLYRLLIGSCRIKRLDDKLFEDLDSLQILDFYGNQLDEYPNATGLDVLRQLTLSYNKFEVIVPAFFDQYGNMKELFLQLNEIRVIEEHSFDAMVLLETLSLAHNNLSFVPANLFEKNTRLLGLFLEGNRFTVFDPDTFTSLTNLEILYISDNPIESVYPTTFSTLASLGYLAIYNCQIADFHADTFRNLTRLVQLEIYNNSVESFPPGLFSSLTNIGNADYTWFELSNNKITRLSSNSFARYEHLERIFMNNNQINAIERNFFDNFPSLRYLNAEGNLCIDKNFVGIESVEDILGEFEVCFQNWDDENETTTTTTESHDDSTTTESHDDSTTQTTTPGRGNTLENALILIFIVNVLTCMFI
jgi:Leucine-rich repeat (LRR) protein